MASEDDASQKILSTGEFDSAATEMQRKNIRILQT